MPAAKLSERAELDYRPAVWFGVLGRLEVRRSDGSSIQIAGPARRQVLAALLCRTGAFVTTSALIDDVWGTAPPRSAVGTLRSHITRLRDDLGRDDARPMLITEGDGYRLQIGEENLDATTFERMTLAAAAEDEPARAIRRYDSALALWRDEAYLDFGDAPFAVSERIRLAELRALARERRTDLVLSVGRADELIPELEQRVRAEPYRERGWEQLSLALYRAGRQADALGACRRARQVLVDDLGVDPGPGLQTLERRLLQQDPELLAVPVPAQPVVAVLERCPYLGLAGYDERDAPLFVGRERLTSVLAGRLADQSVVVVTGASGVGKSSLVRAGLIPALRAGALPGSASWRIEVRTPADGAPAARGGQPRPDLLVLDQAEELFTGMALADREALLAGLLGNVRQSGARLLVVLRSDFYGRLADFAPLAPFADQTAVLVGPMRSDELRRALLEPAATAGLRLEDELVEAIMEDVAGQPEPLPLLSEAMVRTWQRRAGNVLTLDGYQQAGALAGALEAAADECYTRLDEPSRRAARHLLVRMAAPTDTGWVRRAMTGYSTQGPAEEAALAALIAARLVVASDQRVEITHDALLTHWPRLREWLDERRAAAALLAHLDQAATNWRSSGRQDADLYRGPRLTAAVDWRGAHPADVSPAEEEFLDASSRAADAELAATREQLARVARGRRNLRRIAAILGVVVVLAVAGGAVALYERGTARSQSSRARQAALAADARRLAALSGTAPDIATSSLLAVAAYRLQHSSDTRGALLDAVQRNQSALWRIGFPHRPQRVFATPDGSRLAVNDNTYNVMLIDPRTRRQVGRAIPTIGFLDGITADARAVVSNGPTNTEEPHWKVSAYEVPTGKEHVLTTSSGMDTWYSTMTRDGRWVAVITTRQARGGAVVDIFDSRNWSARPREFVTAGAPAGLAAGQDLVAVEHTDGSVEVRALPSWRLAARLPATRTPASLATALDVSPDGSHVARVDPADPRRIVLYAVRGAPIAETPLPVQPGPIVTTRFTPDGAQLAVSTNSGSLAVYGTADGAETHSFAGQAGSIGGIDWTGVSRPAGLYTVGLDGDLVSWDLGSGPRLLAERGPDYPAPKLTDLFGTQIVGMSQVPNTPNSTRRIYTVNARTGDSASWPAGLIDANGRTQGMAQITASDNGTYGLADIGGIYGSVAGHNRVEIFDLRAHRDVGHLVLPGTDFFPDGYFAVPSPDGRRAYCNCSPSHDRVDVFALPSGKFLTSFRVRFPGPAAGQLEPECWRFDPAGRLVVFGWSPQGLHQRIGVVDVVSHRLIAQTDLGTAPPLTAIAWSHDLRTVAVGTAEGTVAIYDAATLSVRTKPIIATSGNVNSLSFAPDDQALVVGGTDGAVRFLNLPDLTPEGERLSIGGYGGPLWAWYAPNGDVFGLAPDTRRPNGQDVRWFTLHVATPSLVASACQLAGADITRAQWQRYVGDRPYEHVCPARH